MNDFYERHRRKLDFVGAVGLAVAFAPVALGAAIAIRTQMGGPVLHHEKRRGLNGETFVLHKFRTKKDGNGNSIKPENLHPVARFLRRASIDEYPQLWNVLKGEMSIIGPRPITLKYDLPQEFKARDNVLPGLTGYAQTQGYRTMETVERRQRCMELDTEYATTRSFATDLKILLKTPFTIRHFQKDAPPEHASNRATAVLGTFEID